MPTNAKTSKQILMKDASTFTFGDKMWVGVHMLSQITDNKYKKHVLTNDKSLHKVQCSFCPRPKGSGDIAMSLASVRRLSVRPYVRS